MDGGYSNGLIAVRVRDVSTVATDRSFETEFARTQPQPAADVLATIDLDRTGQAIGTMSKLAFLVGIERDRVLSDSIWIGEYVGKRGKWFGLHEVRPDATWHRKPLYYRLKTVTSIAVSSHYLTALAVVASDRPGQAS